MERLAGLWRAVVACAVALVLGACVGVLVEHQHAEDTSNATPSATSPSDPASTNWFHGHVAESCPALKAWYLTVGKSVYTLKENAAWPVKRAALMKGVSSVDASYRSLLPLATPAAKAQLQVLLTSNGETGTSMQQSATLEAFLKKPAPTNAAQLTRDVRVMTRAAQSCLGSTTSTTKAKTPGTT